MILFRLRTMFGVFFLKLLSFFFNQKTKLASYPMKINIIALFILLFHFNIYAQQYDIPFKKGEKLEYKIHYGPITAGRLILKLKPFQININLLQMENLIVYSVYFLK